jgi:hypothetical protein
MAYYIRYSDSEQWLQDDLKRGYSFKGYQFDASPEGLLEEAGYDLDEDDVESLVDEYNVQEHSNGQWGFALDGLCGYGPFETMEEAREESRNGSYGIYTTCGIFEGYNRGIDLDSNASLFHPIALIKVFETSEVAA